MSNINIYMVRHGETYFNFLHRFQGWSDAPLTKKGIGHGLNAGERLANVHFDAAYSSDLTRAIHTAQYVLSNNQSDSPLTPSLLPDFREQFFGSFEGVITTSVMQNLGAIKHQDFANFSELVTQYGMPDAMNTVKAADPFNFAENNTEFWQRIDHGFDTLRQQHQAGQNILLVSHGTAIRAITEKYTQNNYAQESVKNGAVTRLTLSPNQVDVVSYNDDQTIF